MIIAKIKLNIHTPKKMGETNEYKTVDLYEQ